jgi:hypothetical protein
MDYPDFLEVIEDRSDCSRPQYVNAEEVSANGHPLFRIALRPDRRRLFPGEDSLPVHLRVSAPGCGIQDISLMESARARAMEHRTFFPLAVRFRVYASEKPE